MKPKFCPKCKSENVQRNITALSGAIGVMADWKCDDCGFQAPEFPDEKINKKMKIKKK